MLILKPNISSYIVKIVKKKKKKLVNFDNYIIINH